MIDQSFRSWLAPRASGWIGIYRRLGLSPNAVTLAGCAVGFAAAVAVSQQQFWLALALWWFGRLLDGTDGIYARADGRVTAFGGYLDIVADMAAYSAMILGFFAVRPDLGWMWLFILFGYVLCITSALSLGSLEALQPNPNQDNRSLRLAAGIAEGGETGIFYTLLLVFPQFSEWFCVVWIVILLSTVGARTILAKKELAAIRH